MCLIETNLMFNYDKPRVWLGQTTRLVRQTPSKNTTLLLFNCRFRETLPDMCLFALA